MHIFRIDIRYSDSLPFTYHIVVKGCYIPFRSRGRLSVHIAFFLFIVLSVKALCPLNGSIYNVTAEKFEKNDMSFLVLYFHDDTGYYTIKRSMSESHPNVLVLNIDNYDEIMQNAKESEKAQTSVETEKLIDNCHIIE